jgi:NTE family protein
VTTAFVLGGGGHLGAHEVGMLRALLERGVTPDVVIGTSIGAINGAVLAAQPDLAAVDRLAGLWTSISGHDVFGGSLFAQLRSLATRRTHVYSNSALRRLLSDGLPVTTFEELAVPLEVCAANIERAAPTYFTSGDLVPAILASSAVPGLLPPVVIDGEHYLDGGIVDSIPLGRALLRGATEVYVLQVGRIETPLTAPRRPWEVALIAVEISRRHRFSGDLERVGPDVTVHVLPTGAPTRFDDPRQLRRDFNRTADRIERSYLASSSYLAAQERTS